MSAISKISGQAVPLRGNDIDTDRIIPARYLRCVTFDGLGEHAFADDRSQLKSKGGLHPFDDERFAAGSILICGSNFGCGSSREHAPQSLSKWGIRAIVGVSYAEIFFNNNIAIGVPCVCLGPEEIESLQSSVEQNPQLQVDIDLDALKVSAGDLQFDACLPEGARQMFLRGLWDATGQLLEHSEAVRARASALPYLNHFAD